MLLLYTKVASCHIVSRAVGRLKCSIASQWNIQHLRYRKFISKHDRNNGAISSMCHNCSKFGPTERKKKFLKKSFRYSRAAVTSAFSSSDNFRSIGLQNGHNCAFFQERATLITCGRIDEKMCNNNETRLPLTLNGNISYATRTTFDIIKRNEPRFSN